MGRSMFLLYTLLRPSTNNQLTFLRAAVNSLCRTLAAEEPEIVAISVRPGVVDTPMQQELIAEGMSVLILICVIA